MYNFLRTLLNILIIVGAFSVQNSIYQGKREKQIRDVVLRIEGSICIFTTSISDRMKIAILMLCTFVATFAAHSQSSGETAAQFVFLPGGLHFAPLKAHLQEPRLGVLKFLDAAEMKVDVGNSIDLFGVNFNHARLTAG